MSWFEWFLDRVLLPCIIWAMVFCLVMYIIQELIDAHP